ncbi:MAG: V-type ATP synthase subunit I [Clostridiaceae bacterium]|jgi:V/A-type H+-transporting ATPase subunit I|nr:V-type ATP synthase subunit I [Clostridiaceae bacterium]
MSKITMLGLEDQREALVSELMDIGAVEISSVEAGELEEPVENPDVQHELADVENRISEVRTALEILDRYCPEKKPLFSVKRELTGREFEEVLRDGNRIWDVVRGIIGGESETVRIRNEENRIENLKSSLVPWKEYPFPLETQETHRTAVVPGTIPNGIDMDRLLYELEEKAPFSELKVISSDKDQHYVFVLVHKDEEQDCVSFLRMRGFARATFPEMTGTVGEIIGKLDVKLMELAAEKESVADRIRSMADSRRGIEVLHDSLLMEQEKLLAGSRIIVTRKAFLIKGWIPSELAEKAKGSIESKFTVSVEITEPEKDEETPVLLRNKGIAEAGEPVSKMYSLPSSREIDPNLIMTLFFVTFFGIMFGDGGYGLIMALGSGFVLWKFRLEDETRKFIKLILWCGISTIFWGAMFGSWFGIESLSKYALWLNPVEQTELFLSWALLFGVIHMYAGFGIKAANLIRDGRYLDALFDVGFVMVFYTGIILVLLPYVPEVDADAVAPLVNAGQYVALAGAVLLLVTQGRNSKNLFGKLFGGLPSLYNAVSFLSDVLSYSRLVALGLATGIIASIMNELGTMFEMTFIIKIFISAAILAVGHVFNFAINALGAYVHSSRLQYLEFFGKFFTGGGQPFRPLKPNTKYITLKHDADT